MSNDSYTIEKWHQPNIDQIFIYNLPSVRIESEKWISFDFVPSDMEEIMSTVWQSELMDELNAFLAKGCVDMTVEAEKRARTVYDLFMYIAVFWLCCLLVTGE